MIKQSGKLRHRIDIEERTGEKDEDGQPLEDDTAIQVGWQVFAPDVFASVEPMTGRELFEAQQVSAEITHKITIRFREGVKPEMRIDFRNRKFHLVQPPINEDELNESLVFLCKERK